MSVADQRLARPPSDVVLFSPRPRATAPVDLVPAGDLKPGVRDLPEPEAAVRRMVGRAAG